MIILWGFTVSFVLAKFERFALTKKLVGWEILFEKLKKIRWDDCRPINICTCMIDCTVCYLLNQTSLVLGEGVLNLKMPSF